MLTIIDYVGIIKEQTGFVNFNKQRIGYFRRNKKVAKLKGYWGVGETLLGGNRRHLFSPYNLATPSLLKGKRNFKFTLRIY